ncbi:MAG: glycosyltransferase family 2 protein [Candidatus Moranbacteria bacterium]|nr:glycosyltransferase family 2 protein [Candidatus Moranbacteria bacterium]
MNSPTKTELAFGEFLFPDPRDTDPRKHRIQRALEIVPGTLSWTVVSGILLASWLAPIVAAVFVILYDIYWLFLTAYVTLFSVLSYHGLRRGMRINWWERLVRSHDPESYRLELVDRAGYLRRILREERMPIRQRAIVRREQRELLRHVRELSLLSARKNEIMDHREIIHAVLLPTAGEDADIIAPAIRSIAESTFPKSQIIVILATEEREPESTRLPKVERLRKEFDGVFRDFIVTTHEVAEGELKCKASNAAYAAKKLRIYLDERNIPYNRVIFSNFDCDTVAHPEYFSALAYSYVTDPDRLRRAYQPLPMYHNNLWDTNAFVRVTVTGSSFWHMYQGTRREMVTFSSHSEPFDTLVRVGYWPVNMISEDSVIYWKAFSYFHGDYKVKLIPLPVSLDAVLADTYMKTLGNAYKQNRRWAYGIENFPVMMRAFWPDKKMPFFRKLRITEEILEGHLSWATAPLILSFLGWLPLFLGGTAFNESVLAHNLPVVTRTLMTLSMGGLVTLVFLSFLMLPKRPKRYGRLRTGFMFAQWFLAPFVALLMATPALDAQTRILLGKYFGEFWVTEKVRKK